ncbi:MAG: hypothetical protein ACI9UT_001386 [Flavobacteriales bacterium]
MCLAVSVKVLIVKVPEYFTGFEECLDVVSLGFPPLHTVKTVATAIKIKRIGNQFTNIIVINIFMLGCLDKENS